MDGFVLGITELGNGDIVLLKDHFYKVDDTQTSIGWAGSCSLPDVHLDDKYCGQNFPNDGINSEINKSTKGKTTTGLCTRACAKFMTVINVCKISFSAAQRSHKR